MHVGAGITIVLFMLMPVLSGCGPRNVYDSLRYRQGLECGKLQGADQAECERRSDMSYDEYQRQRSGPDQRR